MSARVAVFALFTASVAACLVAGCADTTSAASWRIRFDPDGGVSSADAVRVRLRVFAGGCEGAGLVYQADLARTDVVPPFGEIGEGTFGFEAVARDATCTVVARGCTSKTLPLAAGDEVVTVLESVVRAAPLCASSACTDGVCAPDADGGGADASLADAGPVDAGSVDAGPVDAGPVDAGPVDAGAD